MDRIPESELRRVRDVIASGVHRGLWRFALCLLLLYLIALLIPHVLELVTDLARRR